MTDKGELILMEPYEKLRMEIIVFENEDVITESTELPETYDVA